MYWNKYLKFKYLFQINFLILFFALLFHDFKFNSSILKHTIRKDLEYHISSRLLPHSVSKILDSDNESSKS
jgi:hypothetical protein